MHINNGNIWQQSANRINAFSSGSASFYHLEPAVAAKQSEQALQHNRMIIGDNNANSTHRCGYPGNSTRSSTPWGEDESTSDPLSLAIRERSELGPQFPVEGLPQRIPMPYLRDASRGQRGLGQDSDQHPDHAQSGRQHRPAS